MRSVHEGLGVVIECLLNEGGGSCDSHSLKKVARLETTTLNALSTGREVSDSCLQYWGGMGFMWDNVASRAFRDTRLMSIGGGADEIMLGIICKLMGILPGKKKKS